MTPFLVSTGLVAVAEIGDKTQLLTLLLAARFRRPLPIFLGILVATAANHALAGLAGHWLGLLFDGDWLRWLLGLSFLAAAAWVLIPDKVDDAACATPGKCGAFIATLVCFFLAEMGDKTQAATVMLAARYDDLVAVVLGTTAGMILANLPALAFGQAAALRVPLKVVRLIAAGLFAILGVAALVA